MEYTTTLVMPGAPASVIAASPVAVPGSLVSAHARVWRQRPFVFVALGGILTDNSTRVSAAGGP